MTYLPLVSIIICTHRRPELLRLALESLAHQEKYPYGSIEIIVVDNDFQPNPQVQEITSQFENLLPAIYIHEPRIGLSFARNTGGQAAKAGYIGYLDDDAKAYPGYVNKLLKVLHTFQPDLCGGPYFPFYLGEKPDWYRDQYGSSTYGSNSKFLTSQEYLKGGNIIFRRNILDEFGWFDSNLGMKGHKTWYGEETYIQIKAWKKKPDLRVYYDPEVVVDHLVPKSKMTVGWFYKMQFKLGSSMPYFWVPQDRILPARRQAGWKLFRICLKLVFLGTFGMIFRDRHLYPYWQNFAVEKMAQSFAFIGQEIQYFKDWLLRRPLHVGLY